MIRVLESRKIMAIKMEKLPRIKEEKIWKVKHNKYNLPKLPINHKQVITI